MLLNDYLYPQRCTSLFEQHHLYRLLRGKKALCAQKLENGFRDGQKAPLFSLSFPRYTATLRFEKEEHPEFLSALKASPVYELYGLKGLAITKMPPLNQPSLEGDVAYHIRTGKHDINSYDWSQYIKFADKYFK